jgi:HEAT repeat protein
VAKVRAAAIEALAATGHPDAQAVALRAVNDYSLHVRLAAIRALGKLPAQENDAKLNELAENTSDVIRTAAVRALVDRGDLRALARAALDPSWRVRSAAAEELLRLPYAERSKLAQALVADASLSVQQRMLESLAEWPLAEAIPPLLAALEGRTSTTRRGAAEQLQERWPAAFELSPVAAADTLSAEAARLREIWRRQYAGELPGASTSMSAPASNSAEAVAQAEAAVAELAANALAERRAAALKLAREHALVQLPDASLTRLRMLVEQETDELVWNDLLVFLEHDGRAAAADLAAIAATHPIGEVRRRACAYLGKHPSRRSTEVLLHSLADSDVTVVREAIRGLGHQPAIDDLSPLRAVLTSADNSLSLEAAVSLARLGSDEGLRALLRLIQHQDPALRRQAVSALGDVLDRANLQKRFTDQQRREAAAELVRLLENEHQGDVRRTAEASLQAIGSSDR